MITNLGEVQAHHKRFLAKQDAFVATEMVHAGDDAVEHVQQHPGFKRRTGELQDKTTWRLVRGAGGRILRVQNPAKHANAIEHGARPHVIEARRRKALSFNVGGRQMFRRKVNHPGNKPFRFLYRATNAAGRLLGRRLQSGMRVLAQGF